jgi:phosphoserine phosphatase
VSTTAPALSILSTPEFLSAIQAVAPRIAVFDCDGTLWSPDAGSGFMNWTVETGLLSRSGSEWIADRHRAYHRGEIDELTICGEMVQVYRGLRESEIRASAQRFFTTHIEAYVFPELRALIADLQSKGVEIWAVSSTWNIVIEEALRGFNISSERILGARVEVRDGIVTEKLVDVPTDEGKAASLRRAGVPNPDAVFGNSIHDAAMLQIARRAFPVNPNAELQQLCLQTQWPVYYPEAVAPK